MADASEEPRLPHGYTNATWVEGETVRKRYLGPDGAARRQREATALDRLADLLPVPPLLGLEPDALVLGRVAGVPGQELLVQRPDAVLHEVGRMARQLAEVDLAAVLGAAPPGAVLVHGDFGPQNMLLDPVGGATTVLLDWELTHVGEPYEDVAWAEWVVRTHHPDLVGALPDLFDGFGERPAWSDRHAAMLDTCAWALDFVTRWSGPDAPAAAMWRDRTRTTQAFTA